MNRRMLLLLPLLGIFVSVCYAGYPTKHYTISAMNTKGVVLLIGVDGGRLVLESPELRSRLSGEDAPHKWYVLGTKIKSSTGGGYLAYDPTGKDKGVFLTPKSDAEGTDWTIPRGQGRRNNSKWDSEEWGLPRAASGPLKDWFFDIEEGAEKDDAGKLVDVCRFVLSKRPNVEVSRIYTDQRRFRDNTPSQIK